EAITNPNEGLLVYQFDYTQGFYYYHFGTWKRLSAEGDSWGLKGNSGINPTQNFIGTTDENDLKFKVNNQTILTITKEGKFFNYGDKGSVCFGYYAGANDTSSSYRKNVFIGSYAGYKNNSGTQSVAIGNASLRNNLNGQYNNSIGSYAMYNNISGSNNSAFGRDALHKNITGNGNTAFGYEALYSDTSGNYNVSIGYQSMRYGKTGSNNIALGYKTLFRTVTDNNIAIGQKALYNNSTGYSNIAIGPASLNSNSKGTYLVAIGDSALYSAGSFSDSLSNNVAIGSKALYKNRNGSYNTAVGSQTLNGNIDGNSNVAMGYSALYYNSHGSNQIAIGDSALYYTGRLSSYISNSNVSIGSKTLYNNTTGSNNTVTGDSTMFSNRQGEENTAQGKKAMFHNYDGSNNTALGSFALYDNTNGNNNTSLGWYAGENITGSGNIAIGHLTHVASASENNQLVIGNIIYGNNINGTADTISTGNIGIGVKNPTARLEINGQVKITGGNPGSGKWLKSDANGLAVWDSINHITLYDADSNTLIQVEKNSNEDKIRFDLGGTEYFVFDEGRIEVKNMNGTVIIGENAGSNTVATAGNSVFMGNYAGNQNSTGYSNIAVGSGALYNNTSISNLVAIGDSALYHNGETATGTYEGMYNTAVGSKALFSNNTAINNTALGFWTLKDNTGNFNTAVGAFTLKSNIDGAGNTAFGSNALVNHLHGDNNTALGQNALLSSETGSDNIAIGYLAGSSVTNGANNIIIGNEIGVSSSDSNKLNIGNVIFGTDIYGTSFSGKIGIGVQNPTARLEVNGQVKITGGNPGDGKVLQSNADGLASWEILPADIDIHDELYDTDSNTLIQVEKNSNEDKIRFEMGGTEYFVFDHGRLAIKNTGNSVFIGNSAGSSDDLTSNYNVFVGDAAGHSNTSGSNNTALGNTALYTNVSGNNNTAIGSGSLMYNTGNSNSALGTSALRANTSGTQNIAFGYYALPANTSGYNNSALGTSSLFSNTTGHQNTAIGSFSMNGNTTGNKNTSLGEGSLMHNTTGNQNIAIGYSAASNLTTGSNNIIIGTDILAPSATGNNTLNIGNLIYANNMDGVDSTLSTGNIGIGVKNPTARLEVNGQVKITGGNPGSGKWLKSDANGLAVWDSINHVVLYDADSNTFVQVEKNVNEDKIRFNMGGVEYLVLDSGRIEVKNTGNSVFIGEEAGLNDDLTNNKNTFTGYQSGKADIIGYENSAYGYHSLLNCTGSRNTAIGSIAGSNIANGWYNIMIGYNAQPTSSLSSSQLNIGNIIYGTGISLTTPKIGIGVADPVEKLDVLGNFQVKQTNGSVYTNIESTVSGASLYLKAAGSNLSQIKFYDNGYYGGSMGFDNDEDRIFFYQNGNVFVKDGNLLPGSHKGSDLGLNGMAWDDIYYDDLFNQGAAAFVNRNVTKEIVNHPPKAKIPGSFDDKTDRGLPELDPASLPEGLHQNNAILTDELTTYNYKANYEQQLLIDAQQQTIKQQQQTINDLSKRLERLEKMMDNK
ncbi:MAG: hypothetical protein DRJ09_12005, partial [Bacteroidetes bacterium]